MKAKKILVPVAIVLAIFCLAFTCTTLVCKISNKIEEKQPAKYVFLFIGDGMGHAQASLAESYLSYKQGVLGGEQLCFTTFPYLGTCFTYSASDFITDSSAAGTAIASGEKTNNGWLGVDPEKNPVNSMAVSFKEMGYNIGIYSSVPVNHATPASFYAHNASRNNYYDITKDIVPADFNFYGGSNILQFRGKFDDEPDSETWLEENGYQVAFGQKEFDEIKDSSRVVLLAEPRENEEGEVMLLADMTRNALDFLGDKKPFFIMCEGGEIDYMCHANKTMPTVEAVIKFDDAIKVAYDFYLKHPKQTLIVVTADHETGGVTLGSAAGGYKIDWGKIEKSWEESGHVNNMDIEGNRAVNQPGGIDWTTPGHTGAPVPIYAIGKGAEKFMGRMDNTDIIDKILCR